MKVVVVGAGIIGTSVAYRLAEAGAEVVVFDERGIGLGTSSVTYAWVNACEKLTSRAYYELNMAGRSAHARICDELGSNDWYPRPGVVQWQNAGAEAGGVDDSPQEQKLERLLEWGYPARLIEAAELQSLEPEIAPSAYDGRAAILYPEDGWCHAVLYSGRVAGAARERFGARFERQRVARILVDGERCVGVQLAAGREVRADVVINCAGRWFNDVIEDPQAKIPLKPTAGVVAYTAPAGLQLTRGLRTPTVNLRPDGAGRLLLRAGDIDEQVDAEAPAEAARPLAEELMRRARALLPALEPVPLEACRVAVRPQPADSYSAIGPLPSMEGLYAAVTHSGVTIGPFIGEAVVDELVHGRTRPELADFRPARFFERSAT